MKTDERIAGECCWCERDLSATIQGIGASDTEAILSQGTFHEVHLPKSERSINAAMTKPGSVALTEGYHLMFATCSEACTQELKKALSLENGRFEKQSNLNAIP